jgi:hypothetical protein
LAASADLDAASGDVTGAVGHLRQALRVAANPLPILDRLIDLLHGNERGAEAVNLLAEQLEYLPAEQRGLAIELLRRLVAASGSVQPVDARRGQWLAALHAFEATSELGTMLAEHYRSGLGDLRSALATAREAAAAGTLSIELIEAVRERSGSDRPELAADLAAFEAWLASGRLDAPHPAKATPAPGALASAWPDGLPPVLRKALREASAAFDAPAIGSQTVGPGEVHPALAALAKATAFDLELGEPSLRVAADQQPPFVVWVAGGETRIAVSAAVAGAEPDAVAIARLAAALVSADSAWYGWPGLPSVDRAGFFEAVLRHVAGPGEAADEAIERSVARWLGHLALSPVDVDPALRARIPAVHVLALEQAPTAARAALAACGSLAATVIAVEGPPRGDDGPSRLQAMLGSAAVRAALVARFELSGQV